MLQGVPYRIRVVADAGDGLDVHRMATEELEKALDLDATLHSAAIERAEILREVGLLNTSAAELEHTLSAAAAGVESKKGELVAESDWMGRLLRSDHGMGDELDLLINPQGSFDLRPHTHADRDESESQRRRSRAVRQSVRSLVKDQDYVDIIKVRLGYVYHELEQFGKALGSLCSAAASEIATSVNQRDFFTAMLSGQLDSSSSSSPSSSTGTGKATGKTTVGVASTAASVRAAQEIFAIRPVALNVPPRVGHMVAALSGALTVHGPFAGADVRGAENAYVYIW